MPWSKDNLPPSVKGKDWTDAQKAAFVSTANAMLEKGIDEGECIATATKRADEVTNAMATTPKFYYAKHMQPGVAAYENENLLVDTDAMKQMLTTGKGMPVYVLHQTGVPLDQQKERAGGYITRSFYNELDGWAWFEIMLLDDDAQDAIRKGWSVSNAYVPTKFSGSGTKNNVPFQRQVLEGKFTHLALVPNPRYENACVMTPEQFAAYQDEQRAKLKELTNSTPSKGTTMLKFLKILLNGKTEEVTTLDDATHVMNAQSEIMTRDQAVEMLNGKTKKNDDEDADKKAKAEAEAEEKENGMKCNVDGIEMTMGQLKNSYRAMKKNEDESKKKMDEEEKKNAEEKAKKDAEEKQNAIDTAAKAKIEADAKAKAEAEMTNGKGFYEMLMNANTVKQPDVVVIDTPASQSARGTARYGSAAIQK